MPYQSVNSPRFYINEPLWSLNNGYEVNIYQCVHTKKVNIGKVYE